MLGKLLKYELKAMGRVLLPLYLVMIAACGLFALNIKLTEKAAIGAHAANWAALPVEKNEKLRLIP